VSSPRSALFGWALLAVCWQPARATAQEERAESAFPFEPLHAWPVALGGAGVALRGAPFSLLNPAASVGEHGAEINHRASPIGARDYASRSASAGIGARFVWQLAVGTGGRSLEISGSTISPPVSNRSLSRSPVPPFANGYCGVCLSLGLTRTTSAHARAAGRPMQARRQSSGEGSASAFPCCTQGGGSRVTVAERPYRLGSGLAPRGRGDWDVCAWRLRPISLYRWAWTRRPTYTPAWNFVVRGGQ
jgi:hypothetical protein